MRAPGSDSFRTEAAVIAIACVSVAALSFILVQDTVSRTETTLRSSAEQELFAAARELADQYRERSAYGATPISELPTEVQDLSLRGLSLTVLRSYKSVAGGFYDLPSQTVVGSSSGATGDPVAAAAVRMAVQEAREDGEAAAVMEQERDLLLAVAVNASDSRFAWAVHRLQGVRDPVLNRRVWWLAALVIAALSGVAGVVSISVRLRRGVEGIRNTLTRLEEDFTWRPPQEPGVFGDINAAIARMADRRIELEGSLRRQDRLAALGKVVAGVAHEIRNPLNSIRLRLELLKRKIHKGTASVPEVETAMEQVDRLDLILQQLLGFGKPALTERRRQRLFPLMQRSAELVSNRSNAKHIAIRVESDAADALEADVDSVRIEQVIINLLLNAIEASPEADEVILRMRESGGFAEIEVSDNGSGIPEPARDHVFDAFFTTRQDGTGLGLAVSREIVTAHQGQIEFSTSPAGTTFVVRLPANGRRS